MAIKYKIHPTIGVARLGNAEPDSRFIGPEVPGCPSELYVDSFRSEKKIRRQGARFRVFAYQDNHCLGEVRVRDDVASITWTVHLANKKAYWYRFEGRTGETSPDIPPNVVLPYTPQKKRNYKASEAKKDATRRKRLIIDSGRHELTADGKDGSLEIRKGNSLDHKSENWPQQIITNGGHHRLGKIYVDSEGRLTVVGGEGKSVGPTAKLKEYANNDNWFDDTSDGPVMAKLHLKDGSVVEAAAAWVIVGPTRFAPAIKPVVNLHDAIFDVAVRYHQHKPALYDWKQGVKLDVYGRREGEFKDDYRPSFCHEVYPILRAAELAAWSLAQADHISLDRHHGWDYDSLARHASSHTFKSPAAIYAWLRQVENWNNPDTWRQMPRLHGDNDAGNSFLTLTRTQLHVMRQWSRGVFKDDWTGPLVPPSPYSPITPEGLDRAALENCIGGAFYPGIEAGWIMRDPRIYLPDDPFRINVLKSGAEEDVNGLTPGSATMRSALPWQADFNDCNDQWWPSHRPTDVWVAHPKPDRKPSEGDTDPPTYRWTSGIETLPSKPASKRYKAMVDDWHKLGFLLSENRDGMPPFVERERDPHF